MRASALRVFHELQATSHEPVSKTPTPALPKGEGVLSDANHSPLTAVSSFQPSGPLGSREPVRTGVVSVARACRKKRWWAMTRNPYHDFRSGPGSGFSFGDEGEMLAVTGYRGRYI